jgi:transposase
LTVKRFSEDFKEHNGDINNIKNVSCDMSPAFIKGTKYIWLKNENTLTVKQREQLELLAMSKINIKTMSNTFAKNIS